jgi:hypothetical protein
MCKITDLSAWSKAFDVQGHYNIKERLEEEAKKQSPQVITSHPSFPPTK